MKFNRYNYLLNMGNHPFKDNAFEVSIYSQISPIFGLINDSRQMN
ncbi:hypothetical protein [cyanobacterium endosymbiont of Rhopalodia gibberula]|nr:hypothetical protein [cyanobacterium endosymbiont of Rhopalodia gibberula]